MAVWSVSIVPAAKPGGPATFVAQNQPNAPVGSITADQGDAISWNNTTDQPHCISVLADPGKQPTDPDNTGYVAPGHQTAALQVPAAPASGPPTYVYTCLIHQNETGTIAVS
jgi:plastocyanin